MLFRTLYTVVSMPYLSLSAVMTTDSNERGSLASFRMIAATGGGLLIAFFTLKLVGLLGGGDQMRGFLLTAVTFGVLATLILWFTFATTREEAEVAGTIRPSMGEMARMLRGNHAFWLLSASLLMLAMASTFFGKTIPYFFKYGVGREDLIGPALATITATAMLSIPIWTQVMRRTSKRTVSLAGVAVGVVGYLAFWWVPLERVELFIVVLAVVGSAAGAAYLTFWAMVPDTVEYGEWRSGVRAEGMVFGFVSFVQKAALGLGVGLLGETLGAIGYVANQNQSPETLEQLRLVMMIAPVVFAILSGCFIALYRLDRRTHGRLVNAIAQRKLRQARRLAHS
jgi:GPH family glycoside/pentoside/hexuronide:cation symporter